MGWSTVTGQVWLLNGGMDLLLGATALTGLAPLLLLIAMAIKLTSPGPVLFRQIRMGRHGQLFIILKFRTMFTHQADLTGLSQTTRNDPRVTPIGRVLRRFSLDELPQLLNVLWGDMALVGPRPHVPGMQAAGRRYEDLVPGYDLRHAMRPGLTGWAQVNGLRGPTTNAVRARQRVQHDLSYIQNFSIRLDLKILLMTMRGSFYAADAF